jgi:hypothetical protein
MLSKFSFATPVGAPPTEPLTMKGPARAGYGRGEADHGGKRNRRANALYHLSLHDTENNPIT